MFVTVESHSAPLEPTGVWGKGFVACEVAFVPLLTVHMNGAVPECPTS